MTEKARACPFSETEWGGSHSQQKKGREEGGTYASSLDIRSMSIPGFLQGTGIYKKKDRKIERQKPRETEE